MIVAIREVGVSITPDFGDKGQNPYKPCIYWRFSVPLWLGQTAGTNHFGDKKDGIMNNVESSRSWFCVWNNPQEFYTDCEPAEMAEKALETWVTEHPTRSGAVAYCVSADGLIHFHMVLEDANKARFSALKKLYPKAHLEPTKGTKEQAEDYINKRGKFTEKGEQVIYIAKHGEIKGAQGGRRDLEIIADFIEQGMTPREVMALNIAYRRYEKMIRDHYFAKREKETPVYRDIRVVWHVGEAGTGKTYTYVKLMEEHPDDVYLVTDYDGGGLDMYCGERYLFLDEFRGQIRYGTLLGMLQGYRQQFHARYTNVIGLWNEVHISSVLPPECVYKNMVSDNRNVDTMQQLYRRISNIVYHWKDDNGGYCQYELAFEKYTTYEALKQTARGDSDGFVTVTDAEQASLPFE